MCTCHIPKQSKKRVLALAVSQTASLAVAHPASSPVILASGRRHILDKSSSKIC